MEKILVNKNVKSFLKKIASQGGIARAKKLSHKRMSEIGKLGAKKRKMMKK